MALLKHVLQSNADKSAVHCARQYNVSKLVKFFSSVANFLPEREFAAPSTTVFIAPANKLLKRSVSVSLRSIQ